MPGSGCGLPAAPGEVRSFRRSSDHAPRSTKKGGDSRIRWREAATQAAAMNSARAGMALILIAVLLIPAAQAGCYGRGKPHRVYPPEQHYWNHVPAKRMDVGSLPPSFTWCNHEGVNHCTPSWNQHIPRYCGSCWVHGTLHMIQDRLKIRKLQAGNLSPDVMLGRQTLLNCAGFLGFGDGCNGGEPLDVFKYMAQEGLPDQSCQHYSATDHHEFKKKGRSQCPADALCRNCMPTGEGPEDFKCWAVKQPVLYKITAYGKIEAGEEALMSEIYQRGPVVCGITAPDDFVYHYHSAKEGGVYRDRTNDTEVDHDVEVVGWGVTEEGIKYWEVRNSWGTYWGELGWTRVERGTNALRLEDGDCWYAQPEHSVEDAVAAGELEGSMTGLKHGHKHHHATHPKGQGPRAHQQQQGVNAAAKQVLARAGCRHSKGQQPQDGGSRQQQASGGRKVAPGQGARPSTGTARLVVS